MHLFTPISLILALTASFVAARKCAICHQTIVEPAIQTEPKKVYRLESRQVQPDCVVCGYAHFISAMTFLSFTASRYSQVSGTTKKINGWAYCVCGVRGHMHFLSNWNLNYTG
jgi:hypothetical protein